MSKEPEQDPMDKVLNFLNNLLDQHFVQARMVDAVRERMTHDLTERALEGGVAPHHVWEFLSFGLEGDGPFFLCTPHNLFTMLLTLGIVRDPEILQALTTRTMDPDGSGAWRDRFDDERGSFVLQFTPPDHYEGILNLNHPAEWIQVNLNLPGEGEV